MRRRLLFVTALVISLVAGAATMANRPAEAAFSGLDEQITFTRQLPGGNGEIFAMNSDGSGQTNLTNDPRFDYFSAGSPEGEDRLYWSSERRHRRHLRHERRRKRPDERDKHFSVRRSPGLVARRHEDCLRLSGRLLGGLRHERRRKRPDGPDEQSGA
jgi:hypothetical protein